MEELRVVQEFYSHCLSDDQNKKVHEWSVGKQPTKEDEYEIRLKHLDGSGFSTLKPTDHPDFLSAAARDRQVDLGKQKTLMIQDWIDHSNKKNNDFDERIRIFLKGLDDFENTVEIDLKDFKIDFVEYLYKKVASTDLAILPEHKVRLDEYYDKLLEQSKERKEPRSIQMPINTSGQTVLVERNTDRGVLEAATEMYRKNVSDDNRGWLMHWTRNTSSFNENENQIRVYQRDNPHNFRSFSRFEDIEQIERVSNTFSEDLYVTSTDRKKATLWLESMEPMDKDKQKTIKLVHSTQLEYSVSEELAKSNPQVVSDLLADASWTTTSKNRGQILKWLGREDKSQEEQILVAGKTYSRENSLESLKKLVHSLADGGFEELDPEAAKKLLTWIHTKEKHGDDYYLQEKYQNLVTGKTSQTKNKLDRALQEILTEVGKTKKEPNKDKDNDILPSFN